MEYSSLSSLLTPSKESIFGIELEGDCRLCGGTVLSGFSTATSPMMKSRSELEQALKDAIEELFESLSVSYVLSRLSLAPSFSGIT